MSHLSRARVLVLTLALLAGCKATSEAQRPSPLYPPGLGVTGTAEVAAEPDLAVVRMGAEVQAEQASAAQKQVNQIMQRAIAAVREAGVAREDVQTSTLSLEPV